MRGKLKFVVLLVPVAIVCLVFWPGSDEPGLRDHAPAVSVAGTVDPPSGTTPSPQLEPKAPPPDDPAPAAGHRTAAAPSAEPRQETVLICGRCVDADTRDPLAGCTVRVHARQVEKAAVGGDRMAAELEDHLVERGVIDWRDPRPVVTGPDGRFTITIRIPPPVPIELGVEHPERVPVTGIRKDLRDRAHRDVGDIGLERGTIVAGRVRNTEGHGQPGVSVRLNRFVTSGLWIRSPVSIRVQSDANGCFRFPHPVPPGAWSVRAYGRYLASEARTTVPSGVTQHELDVVVRTLPAITGIVVDDAQTPVADAWIDFHPHGLGSRFFANVTGADGSFRLERRPEDKADPVALTVARDGHEVVWRQGSYAWGSSGIVLVLPRGVEVPIRVVDAGTGEPVERFGVRCFSTRADQASVHQPHRRLRHPGPHPDGELRVRGVRHGPNVMMIQPMDGEHLPSLWRTFEVAPGGTPVLVFRVARPVSRTLEVRRKDGQSVAGARVQLVRPAPGGGPITLKSEIGRPGRLATVPHNKLSILLQEGVTDTAGTFVLRGPPGERLAIRLPGPCHQPCVVNDVVLEPGATPLCIEVVDGATLAGRVRPLKILDQLDLMREDPTGAATPDDADRHRPSIRLLPPRTRGALSSRSGQETVIGADGGFEFPSVTPGDWTILLCCSVDFRAGAIRFPRRVNLPVGSVRGLKRGESRRVDLDLGHLAPGRVEGTVYLNDEPLANQNVTLACAPIDLPGQTATWRAPAQTVRTDRQGHFAVACFPGSYRLRVRLGDTRRLSITDHLESEDSISVFPGAHVVRDVHLRGGALHVRLVGSDGCTPVPGLQLAWCAQGRTKLRFTDPTDRDGRVTIDSVPFTTLVFKTWPASLRAATDRRDFVKRNPDGWRRTLVDIGTVRLDRTRRKHDHRFVLPAKAGY